MRRHTLTIFLFVLLLLEVAVLVFGPQTKDFQPLIQAAREGATKADWWAEASQGIRLAAWANVGLLTVLLATSRWWGRRTRPETSTIPSAKPSPTPRWFWPGVFIAVVLALVMRAPLAAKSLWWDESWVVLQASHGKWRPDTKKPGEYSFKEHPWHRTAWYWQKPTNHAPMALAQKASFKTYEKLTGTKPGTLSELAARAPALLASAAAVLFLGLLLRAWGRPGAGILAGVLLAAHPWAIRYGVDARGYALVIPLCIAALFAATRILQTRGHSWGPWVGFGLVEFLWLWAYPTAAFDVAVLNVILLGMLWFLQESTAERLRMSGRLVAVNIVAAVFFLQMFLPNVMQALTWAGEETVSQPLSVLLAKSTLSQLALGVEYDIPGGVESEGLVSAMRGADFLKGLSILIVVGLALAVLAVLTQKRFGSLGLKPWWLLAAPVLGGIAYVAVSQKAGSYFYPRFLIAWLPVLMAVVALLLTAPVGRRFQKWQGGVRNGQLLVGILLLVAVLPFWLAQGRVLVHRPIAPLRDSVKYLKEISKEQKPVLVCYGHGYEIMAVYDPEMLSAVSKSELQAHIDKAKAEGRPLFVMQGHNVFNRIVVPDGFELLDDPEKFQPLRAFAGIEPEFYFRLFRAK